MGRYKTFDHSRYVSHDEDTNLSTCLECNKILKGKNTANIKRHYSLVHNFLIDGKESLSEIHSEKPGEIRKQKKTGHISVKMNKGEFLLCCIGLVTVKNIPLRIFDDEQFFKKLISPYEEKYNTDLSSKKIVQKLSPFAEKITRMISESVSNKMVCLKLDVASQKDKSILGINIQYIRDFQINVNTIGMIQLKKKHRYLNNDILSCMRKFNIDVTQLYSVTIDNGANILRTSKLLQELQEETHYDMEIENAESNECTDNEFENLYDCLAKIFAVVRCAAHAVQLAADDVLQTIASDIEQCRKIVRALRVIAQREENNTSTPVIDNVGRWNSTFEMINSLLKLRSFIDNSNDRLKIPDVDWKFVNGFIEAFQPLAECTKKLNLEQYIVGDFYRDWLCCEVELEDLDSNAYASQLLQALKNRKDLLLKQEAFASAVYLDPRFTFLDSPFLTEPMKRSAVDHLLKIYSTMRRLAGEEREGSSSTESQVPVNSPSEGMFLKLEKKLDLVIDRKRRTPSEMNMKQALEDLAYIERASFETNVLEYWKSIYHRDPELGNLAQIALAVPSTQASIERTFSALFTILSKSKLSPQAIDNLLLVKLNNHLLEHISMEDFNK